MNLRREIQDQTDIISNLTDPTEPDPKDLDPTHVDPTEMHPTDLYQTDLSLTHHEETFSVQSTATLVATVGTVGVAATLHFIFRWTGAYKYLLAPTKAKAGGLFVRWNSPPSAKTPTKDT